MIHVNYPHPVGHTGSRPHAYLRDLPRRFFSRIWPVALNPAAACLPAFDGSSLPCPFPPFCLRCARSPAFYLSTKALAFPISDLGTSVILHCAVPNSAVLHRCLPCQRYHRSPIPACHWLLLPPMVVLQVHPM